METLENKNGTPDIKKLRERIDSLDEQLFWILAQRIAQIPGVAEYKKINHLPIFNPEREEEIIKSKRNMAEKLGIDPNLAQKIMELIMEDSRRIETKIVDKKLKS